MATDLKNKTVVVTGGASGIGYEIADRFLQNGAKFIIILDNNETQGMEAAKTLGSKHGGDKSVYIKCDILSDLDDVFKKIINEYHYVDVLVNSAGLLHEICPKTTIEVNVTALIECSLKFWNYMRIDRGGSGGTIMNVGSIYGFRATPVSPVYQASKFAVMGFTRSLGFPYNFNKTGVRVISINPGLTETAGAFAAVAASNFDNESYEDYINRSEEPWQKVEAVGLATVVIFKRARSGSAWLIEGSKPIVEIK